MCSASIIYNFEMKKIAEAELINGINGPDLYQTTWRGVRERKAVQGSFWISTVKAQK